MTSRSVPIRDSGEQHLLLPDSFPIRQVNVLTTFACLASENMGIDEWLSWCAAQSPGELFVRLTSWSPGGITIGYHQMPDRVLLNDKLGETSVVRRITGGRAIFHDPSEITYTFCLNLEISAESGRSYFDRLTMDVLEYFLRLIGFNAHPLLESSREDQRPLQSIKSPCFSSHTKSEFVDRAGAKLVGRARRHTDTLFFEHGAIKLAGVVSHPALPVNSEVLAAPPVTSERFDHLAVRFQESVMNVLHTHPAISPLSESFPTRIVDRYAASELASSWIQAVRSNPLGERPFGQTPPSPA